MLINSIESHIGKPLLYAATAKDIWNTTQKLYSKRKNVYRLYALRKQVHECKQGTMDVTSYSNELSLIWQKIDLCKEIIWNCPSDGMQHSHLEAVDRIYDFLANLNSKFDVVRGRILGYEYFHYSYYWLCCL